MKWDVVGRISEDNPREVSIVATCCLSGKAFQCFQATCPQEETSAVMA